MPSFSEEPIIPINKQRTGAGTLDVQSLGMVGTKFSFMMLFESRAAYTTFRSIAFPPGPAVKGLFISPNGDSYEVVPSPTGPIQIRNGNREKLSFPLECETT